MFRIILIILLIFNALGAYYGSFMLITDPSGSAIKMPPDMLQGAPFQDYLVPGLTLFFVNGLLPTFAVVGLIRKKPLVPLSYLPMFRNYHWGWTLALLSGLGLLIWMTVQIAMLGYYAEFPIQGLMSIVGLLIMGLASLPFVRNSYKLPKATTAAQT